LGAANRVQLRKKRKEKKRKRGEVGLPSRRMGLKSKTLVQFGGGSANGARKTIIMLVWPPLNQEATTANLTESRKGDEEDPKKGCIRRKKSKSKAALD